MSCVIKKVTTVSSPVAGPVWVVETKNTTSGIEFVELKRGDKSLQAWLTGKKEYNTKVSEVINDLITIQTDVSMAALGCYGNMPHNRASRAAYKALMQQSTTKVVAVTLPGFTCGSIDVPNIETEMPLDVEPTCGCLVLDAKIMDWVWLKCKSMDVPKTRKASQPPMQDKRAYFHKGKGKYVAYISPRDCHDGKKYKVIPNDAQSLGVDDMSSANGDGGGKWLLLSYKF